MVTEQEAKERWCPFTLYDAVEAAVRDGNRIVWMPGTVIGRTLDAAETTRYTVAVMGRPMLKNVPADDVRAA